MMPPGLASATLIWLLNPSRCLSSPSRCLLFLLFSGGALQQHCHVATHFLALVKMFDAAWNIGTELTVTIAVRKIMNKLITPTMTTQNSLNYGLTNFIWVGTTSGPLWVRSKKGHELCLWLEIAKWERVMRAHRGKEGTGRLLAVVFLANSFVVSLVRGESRMMREWVANDGNQELFGQNHTVSYYTVRPYDSCLLYTSDAADE